MVTSMARTLTRSALTWQAVPRSCASRTALELFTVVRISYELSVVTRRPLGYAQQSRGSARHRHQGAPTHQQCEEWSRRAGSAKVSDVAGTFDEVDYY